MLPIIKNETVSSKGVDDNRYETLVQLSPDALYVMQDDRLVFINMAGARQLGAKNPKDLIGLSVNDLVHPDFLKQAKTRIHKMVKTGQSVPSMEQKYIRCDGSFIDVEVCSAPFLYEGKPAIQVIARDITERKAAEEALRISQDKHRAAALEATRAKESLHHEKIIFELIALDESLENILREACLGAEWILPGQPHCSVLLVNSDGTQLQVGAAPSLPAEFSRSIQGASIGSDICSCSAAIFHNKTIVVEDIEKNPLTEKYRDLASECNLRACWSVPITATSGTVLGSFGVYYPEPYKPSSEDLAFIGNISHLVGVAIHKDRVERSLNESEERYRSVVNCLTEGIMVQSRDGRILACNPSAERILRIPANSAVGLMGDSYFKRIVHDDGSEISLNDLPTAAVLRTGKAILSMVVGLEMQTGEMVWISQNILPIGQAGESGANSILISFADVSAVKQAQHRLKFLATHDTLTELPNRAFLVERLSHALSIAQRQTHHIAVLFLDLDRFKNVNDTIGHEAGDKILQTVASRLTACIRETDTLARLGGDEFVILAEGFEEADYLTRLAERILKAIAEPFRLQGYEYYLGVSIGISVHPDDGMDGPTLLRCADSAMYSAKEGGRNHYQFYTSELNERTQQRYHLEKNLRYALDRNELRLHYQPKLDLQTGRVVGAEVLVRWDNPDSGMMLPTEFIPVAEETGLIIPIGRWVLEQACQQTAEWRKHAMPDLSIAVNLSPRQFQDGRLVSVVAEILQRTGLPAHVLEFEITESLLMSDTEKLMPTFDALINLGVTFSLDDFGTGYSSLSYLQRFPIANIKIDRSFIKGIPANRDSVALTQTIIAMARSLNMYVTAEGVEEKAQMAFLKEAGCNEIQGDYFSKPLSANDFIIRFGKAS
ncbi:MAG TPA: EAL domain-containing protein [Burkholderiaceae bacterium]|jgi:diguanylate cyclase (GGDEF)-like protein/PAS domain S-box-containing protein